MEQKVSAEDGFREALKDAVAIVKKVAPYCHNFEEFLGMAELALSNDAQLRMLMQMTAGKR